MEELPFASSPSPVRSPKRSQKKTNPEVYEQYMVLVYTCVYVVIATVSGSVWSATGDIHAARTLFVSTYIFAGMLILVCTWECTRTKIRDVCTKILECNLKTAVWYLTIGWLCYPGMGRVLTMLISACIGGIIFSYTFV
jgi:tryptophan-rich sensory protein